MQSLKKSIGDWFTTFGQAVRAKREAVMIFTMMAVGMFVVLAPDLAMAQSNFGSGQSASTIANNVVTSIQGFGKVINAFCYIGALVMGALSVVKFKANSENHQQTPIKIPLTFLGVSAGLAAVPEVIGTGIVSVWGSGARTVSPTGI